MRDSLCPRRMYALKWSSDNAIKYSGPHVLVNYEVPDFTPMAFISGQGPLVTMWYAAVIASACAPC